MLEFHDTARNGAPESVLWGMFAARKRVFVDLLGWEVPVIDGRFEIDQFDDQHATYLILTDEGGAHLGSARLLPTTRPHILDSLFANLCEGPPPVAPSIFEITRFCLDRALTARTRRSVRNTLVVALVDHALGRGITAYSAIAGMAWVSQVLAFGWRCLPLGMPQQIDGTTLAAIRIEIDATTPARLAAAGIRSSAGAFAADRRVA